MTDYMSFHFPSSFLSRHPPAFSAVCLRTQNGEKSHACPFRSSYPSSCCRISFVKSVSRFRQRLFFAVSRRKNGFLRFLTFSFAKKSCIMGTKEKKKRKRQEPDSQAIRQNNNNKNTVEGILLIFTSQFYCSYICIWRFSVSGFVRDVCGFCVVLSLSFSRCMTFCPRGRRRRRRRGGKSSPVSGRREGGRV